MERRCCLCPYMHCAIHLPDSCHFSLNIIVFPADCKLAVKWQNLLTDISGKLTVVIIKWRVLKLSKNLKDMVHFLNSKIWLVNILERYRNLLSPLIVKMAYLYVSIWQKQVYYNVWSQNFSIIHTKLNSGQLLCQYFSLILVSSFSNVIQKSFLVIGTKGISTEKNTWVAPISQSQACWTITTQTNWIGFSERGYRSISGYPKESLLSYMEKNKQTKSAILTCAMSWCDYDVRMQGLREASGHHCKPRTIHTKETLTMEESAGANIS